LFLELRKFALGASIRPPSADIPECRRTPDKQHWAYMEGIMECPSLVFMMGPFVRQSASKTGVPWFGCLAG
jgi:hypothetical protein